MKWKMKGNKVVESGTRKKNSFAFLKTASQIDL